MPTPVGQSTLDWDGIETMGSSQAVLVKAEQLEMLASEMYRALARRFAADLGAKALFERLEQEEIQHATRIRMLATQYRTSPKDFGNSLVSLPGIDTLLAEARALLARFDDGSPLLRDDALNLMIDLEERFAVAHAHALAEGADAGLVHFFRTLAEQDRAHKELLAARIREP